jgi:hypothetical protein
MKRCNCPIDQYRFISIERDTTYLDTSLTSANIVLIICDEIILITCISTRDKRIIPLQYSLQNIRHIQNLVLKQSILGFEANDIKYSSVATPVTELYYKSTMTKGQSVVIPFSH